MLSGGSPKHGPALCVARALMLFCLNSQTNTEGIHYVLVEDMGCTPTLHVVNTELGCLCLMGSVTEENDHSAVAGKPLNNITELNVIKDLEWDLSKQFVLSSAEWGASTELLSKFSLAAPNLLNNERERFESGFQKSVLKYGLFLLLSLRKTTFGSVSCKLC